MESRFVSKGQKYGQDLENLHLWQVAQSMIRLEWEDLKKIEHFAKVFEGKVREVEPDVAEKLKFGSD